MSHLDFLFADYLSKKYKKPLKFNKTTLQLCNTLSKEPKLNLCLHPVVISMDNDLRKTARQLKGILLLFLLIHHCDLLRFLPSPDKTF